MQKSSISFSSMSYEDWKKRVEKESSVPPERDWEGIQIPKFYTSEHRHRSLEAFDNHVGRSDRASTNIRTWDNISVIREEKEKNANSHALNALMEGADGILFESAGDFDTEKLLADILPEYASLQFSDSTLSFLLNFRHWLDSCDVDHTTFRGYAQLSDAAPEDYVKLEESFEDYPGFRFIHIALGLADENGFASQLSKYLHTLADLLESLQDHDLKPANVWKRFSVSVEAGPLFFEEIARLRAIRMLTYKVFRAFGADQILPEELLVHAISPAWNPKEYQPHANMLKSCTSGLAAILGGCTAISLLPEDPGSALQQRIARNVSLILKEECFLDQVLDPAAGAYYTDHMTFHLARLAWDTFTG